MLVLTLCVGSRDKIKVVPSRGKSCPDRDGVEDPHLITFQSLLIRGGSHGLTASTAAMHTIRCKETEMPGAEEFAVRN